MAHSYSQVSVVPETQFESQVVKEGLADMRVDNDEQSESAGFATDQQEHNQRQSSLLTTDGLLNRPQSSGPVAPAFTWGHAPQAKLDFSIGKRSSINPITQESMPRPRSNSPSGQFMFHYHLFEYTDR